MTADKQKETESAAEALKALIREVNRAQPESLNPLPEEFGAQIVTRLATNQPQLKNFLENHVNLCARRQNKNEETQYSLDVINVCLPHIWEFKNCNPFAHIKFKNCKISTIFTSLNKSYVFENCQLFQTENETEIQVVFTHRSSDDSHLHNQILIFKENNNLATNFLFIGAKSSSNFKLTAHIFDEEKKNLPLCTSGISFQSLHIGSLSIYQNIGRISMLDCTLGTLETKAAVNIDTIQATYTSCYNLKITNSYVGNIIFRGSTISTHSDSACLNISDSNIGEISLIQMSVPKFSINRTSKLEFLSLKYCLVHSLEIATSHVRSLKSLLLENSDFFDTECLLFEAENWPSPESPNIENHLAWHASCQFILSKLHSSQTSTHTKFFQILSEKFFLKSCSNHFDRIFFYAYYLFSSFGLSVVRPLIWFFAFFIIASLLNGIHFINSNPNCTYFLCGTIPGDSGKSALQTAFPYLPINARTEEKAFVFHLLDTFHSLISTVLIFLFSLGIRNLLRLRTAN